MDTKRTNNQSHPESTDDASARREPTGAQFSDNPALDELRALVLPSASLQAMGLRTAAAKDLLSGQTLGDALQSFIRQLTESLKRAANDLTSLEVRTFATSDLSQVRYELDSGEFSGPVSLCALTRIALDGDIQVVLPERDGLLNETLWVAHMTMVKEAQATRAQFLGSMAEMTTRLIALFSKS